MADHRLCRRDLLVAKASTTPGVRAGLVVAGLVAVAAFASLWTFIRRTNFLVSRFIESVRFEDYSQRFTDPSGGGFDVLGRTLDHALKTIQARHTEESAEARYLSAIVDDAPSALLTIESDGRVQSQQGRKAVVCLRSLAPFERSRGAWARALCSSRIFRWAPGKSLALFWTASPKGDLASAQVARLDKPVTVISILPVQSELGALEVAAQADLVRVLTHEIMNSLTPVTSPAQTGAIWLPQAEKANAILADAKTVLTETVARRAGGTCASSKAIANCTNAEVIAEVSKPKALAEEIMRLALANASGDRTIDARIDVSPETLAIEGDAELVAQAVPIF